MAINLFEQTEAATSGPYAGSFLWSDAANWLNGLPSNGDDLIVGSDGVDDIASFSANSLAFSTGSVSVVGTVLSVGTLDIVGSGSLVADGLASGAAATVVVNDVAGSGGTLGALGTGSVVYDLSATDPGETYIAGTGGFVELGSAPADASTFLLQAGTFAFGNLTPGSYAASLQGLAPGDTIEVPGTSVTTVTFGATDLSITTDTGVFDFDNATYSQTVAGYSSAVDPTTGLLAVTLACYVAGTRILTEAGEVAVEDLVAGDHVLTADGLSHPIRWIGRRSCAGRFLQANRSAMLPTRIVAGALGGGLPRRDLLVSPMHAMFVDGLLVPASALVNGRTIVQDRARDRVDYFHIELDRHEVIFAEGAASETYLDEGNRAMFANAAEHHPATVPVQAGHYARRVSGGSELEAIHRRLSGIADRILAAAGRAA